MPRYDVTMRYEVTLRVRDGAQSWTIAGNHDGNAALLQPATYEAGS